MTRRWAAWAWCSALATLLAAGPGRPPLAQAASGAVEETGRRALTLAELDTQGPWRLGALRLEGLSFFTRWGLAAGLQTQARPWWRFWGEDPPFEAAYLYGDLETIRSRLRADGYYQARVEERIVIVEPPRHDAGGGAGEQPGVVEVEIRIDRGPPVRVCSLYVDVESVGLPVEAAREILRRFPVAVGEPFRVGDYQKGAQRYVRFLSEHGHPQAKVQRHARIDVAGGCAEVAYGVEPGPYGVFGAAHIRGLEDLPEEIVRREISWREGEPFDDRRLEATRARLRDTRLFSLVRVEKEEMTEAGEVPVTIEVAPGPPREVRLGLGYGTDDGIRGFASWWNYDFLGDNRRVGISARISQIKRSLDASFVQPHFPRGRDVSSVSFTLGQQDESTYLDSGFLMTSRVDWWLDERLTATSYYSFRYDSLSDVTDATIEDLGPHEEFQRSGFTSTLGSGVRWLGFDDASNPTRGLGLGVAGEVSGGGLGGDFALFRLLAQAAYYHPLPWDLIAAFTFRGGSIVPFGGTPQVPLWARLYAGGNAAFPVRGYGRRRVGPLSGSDDPLGGRTAVVGTAELLYPIVGPVLAVLFLDAGDVELSAWTLRPGNIQKGVGAGLRATTPVGPVEIDFGFGLDHPPGDSVFRVHLTIGPQF